jgi:hypothetical protein
MGGSSGTSFETFGTLCAGKWSVGICWGWIHGASTDSWDSLKIQGFVQQAMGTLQNVLVAELPLARTLFSTLLARLLDSL